MLIYGKEVRGQIKETVQKAAAEKVMALAVLQVGEDPASVSYVNGIVKFGAEVGIQVRLIKMDENSTEDTVLGKITELNNNAEITGIMIQTPLPAQLQQDKILQMMDPAKDVEGIHNANLGQLVSRKGDIKPCTPKAVMRLLDANGIELKGKQVTVVGRSTIVGTPLALMMMDKDATVTLCHSRTRDLAQETRRADIVVAAAGKIDLITDDMVREDSIVIDVGTNFEENGKMRGDVSEKAKNKAEKASAVPGGVGTITVAELFDNLRLLKDKQEVKYE
ncbi:MAG: bifunctional 5,10-methylenetetrahydrofolate dehydrogenase/5,10-methenyltetrahydrofolate cyclohydrolase [Bacillota bacterium]|nr:bifunctional 5,10-methylenetetrahydrofolate dehydrogenase/5,10-methenyltetrahydrofolate cyclohydrolase [Bacillota bacterium]